MKLYEKFADRGFHTTIITTFGVDFDAYENIALSRLRGSGSRNNILVVDQRMLAYALSNSSTAPQFAGRLYSVLGVAVKGVFHTKIILQLGRRQGRLIIGSANATAPGLAGNLELLGAIECKEEPSPAQNIIAACWEYLNSIINRKDRTLTQQLSWMKERTTWLLRAEPANGIVELPDKTRAAFVGTGSDASIMQRFSEFVGSVSVDRLIVISPYWDADLDAIKALKNRFQPKETFLLIDAQRALFPNTALTDLENIHILDISPISERRFIHAKLFLVTTSDTEHVLFGSANCTIAALGRENFAGLNEEACLYRCVPLGEISNALGLNPIIAESKRLEPSDLPEFSPDNELQSNELTKHSPGSFECRFDTLIWWPPPSVTVSDIEIDLLEANKSPLSCKLQRLSNSTNSEVHFHLTETQDRPAFARLKFSDGAYSATAIVTLFDALRREIREVRKNVTDRVIAQLAEETEEGLWLMEVFDELEVAEASDNEPVSRMQASKTNYEENQSFQTLDYKLFVAGSRLRAQSTAVGRNSLSGSELSFVRIFLNRILGLNSDDKCLETQNEGDSHKELLNLGDDVEYAHAAIERGDIISEIDTDEKTNNEEDTRAYKLVMERRQTRDQIIKAAKSFVERIQQRANINQLNSIDILRLRTMLTIICVAGRAGAENVLQMEESHTTFTSLQVLPSSGSDNIWPRILGKVLFSLFGGTNPTIQKLQIEEVYDQIPDDLIECWACCFWVIQACLLATKSKPMFGFNVLAVRIYTLTGLRREEMLDDTVFRVIERMNERFALRLGLDNQSIMDAHRSFVTQRFTPEAGLQQMKQN